MSVDYFVFYHDENALERAKHGKDHPDVSFVDLNALTLPEALKIKGMPDRLNKAIFSEYLGIISVEPRADAQWVGCFTYSIPIKFTASWRRESGAELFFPPLRFEDITQSRPKAGQLFAAELGNPLSKAKSEIRDIHERFPAGAEIRPGPFKGSFIVEREVFTRLQVWLREVMAYLLERYQLDSIPERDNAFDHSSVAQRSDEQRKIDILRHKLGDVIERALAYFLGAQYEDKQKKLLAQDIHARKGRSDLVKKAKALANPDGVVLTFGNLKYKAVVLEWVERIVACGVENYLVVAQDKALHAELLKRGYNSTLKPFEGTLGDFWVFRLEVTQTLLEHGVSVLHCDADAFWLSDARDLIANDDADLIVSQGTIQPPDVVEDWKHVLCCGFFFYRANLDVLAWMDRVMTLSRELKSDQVAINRLLHEEGVEWSAIQPSKVHTFREKTFHTYSKVLRGRSKCGLRLSLVPHEQVQRLQGEYTDKLKVLHLISAKQEGSKIEVLEQAEESLKRQTQGRKNIVWLASYPRSGNTMLRTIFKHNFGIHTYSLYNDKADIGKDPALREFVGHVDGDWQCVFDGVTQWPRHPERLFEAAADDLTLVKTHSQYCDFYKGQKAILVVRDPRAAVASSAHYGKNFAAPDREMRDILSENICIGDPNSGKWSDHIKGWMEHSKDLLVLKYEDLVEDLPTALDQIGAFLGREPLTKDRLDFSEYKKVSGKFFRKGSRTGWSDTLTKLDQHLIWMSYSNTANAFGYDIKPSSVTYSKTPDHTIKAAAKGHGWAFVVTPSFNSASTIDATIQSVVSQAGEFTLRYHIQDGGSTDGTLEKLEAWKRRIDAGEIPIRCKNLEFSYTSAPDAGMYDAINRGFKAMKIPDFGLCTYINADDVIFQGALSTATRMLADKDEIDWLIPSKYTIGATYEHRGRGNFFPPREAITSGVCDGVHFQFLQQEGMVWRYRLWKEAEGFDPAFKYAGDWDLWRRFAALSEPAFASHIFAAFCKRPGQLSEDKSRYYEEIDAVVPAEDRKQRAGEMWRRFQSEPDAAMIRFIGFSPDTGYPLDRRHWKAAPDPGVVATHSVAEPAAKSPVNPDATGKEAELQSALDGIKARYKEDGAKLKRIRGELDALKEKSREKGAKIDKLRSELDVQRRRNQGLTAEVEALRRDRDAARLQLAEARISDGGRNALAIMLIESLRQEEKVLMDLYRKLAQPLYSGELGPEDEALQAFAGRLRTLIRAANGLDYAVAKKSWYKTFAAELVEELRHISPEFASAYEAMKDNLYYERIPMDEAQRDKFVALTRALKERLHDLNSVMI